MKPISARLTLLFCYLTYLFFGMFTAGIGPVLGELSEQTGSSLSAIGGVITFLFLGSIIAQLAAGPLTERLGDDLLLILSLFILSAGILAFINARSLPWMFAFALLAGIGQGGVDMGANLVVADVSSENSTSALNLLHFFFGLGAFIGPALVGLAIAATGSGLLINWIVAGLLLLLALAMSAVHVRRRPLNTERFPAPEMLPGGTSVYLSPLLWLMGALMLVYVGVEIGLGSWISAYMGITTDMLPQFGAWTTSAYWAALAVGRLAGAAASSRMTRLRLLALALGGSLLGGLALLVSRGHVIPTVLSLAWIAFAYGTVYPTTVALAAGAFSASRGKAVSILVAMGSIGAAVLPLLAGQLLERSPDLGYLAFVVISLGLLVVLLIAIARMMRPTAKPAPP